ncbi:MAG: TIR domain-containing protein [Candidatus Omnitrophica bacterium]|nr:TIR domain-containing protein [Candidatus Omnitrophota bacterium]
MVTIFISHSKKDVELVKVIDLNLRNVGIAPILREFTPESKPPYADIDADISRSDAVFAFLTQNVKVTDHTQNWVTHEITKAHDLNKPTYIIEDRNNPVHFPIPKLRNYILYDQTSIRDWILIQNIASSIKRNEEIWLGALAAGAAGVLLFKRNRIAGFLGGAALGGILLALTSPEAQLRTPAAIECDKCGIVFNLYTNLNLDCLHCPSCRTMLSLISK